MKEGDLTQRGAAEWAEYEAVRERFEISHSDEDARDMAAAWLRWHHKRVEGRESSDEGGEDSVLTKVEIGARCDE